MQDSKIFKADLISVVQPLEDRLRLLAWQHSAEFDCSSTIEHLGERKITGIFPRCVS